MIPKLDRRCKERYDPNGLRVGTPAMTSRGLMEEDFVKIGQYLVDHLGQVLRETIPGW